MEREIDLKEISDGRLYSSSDMVKADCGDCKGCSACCQGMGSSILLDPYDIYRLSTGTGLTFEDLLKDRIELNMSDGLILPNLKMAGEKEAAEAALLDAQVTEEIAVNTSVITEPIRTKGDAPFIHLDRDFAVCSL